MDLSDGELTLQKDYVPTNVETKNKTVLMTLAPVHLDAWRTIIDSEKWIYAFTFEIKAECQSVSDRTNQTTSTMTSESLNGPDRESI